MFRAPLTFKPGDARIDWTKPTTRRLKQFWLMHEGGGDPRDLVTGRTAARAGDTAWARAPLGPVLDFDGNGDYAEDSATLAQTLPLTLIARIRLDTWSSAREYAGVLVARNTSETSMMLHDASGVPRLGADYQESMWSDLAGPTFSVGAWTTLAVSISNTGLRYYAVDSLGVRTTTAGTGTPSNWTDKGADGPMRLGGSSYDPVNRCIDGQMAWAAWFDRALSTDEIRLLHDDPLNALLMSPPIAAPGSGITFPPGQVLAPTSVVSAGSWLKSSDNTSTNLHTMVDESVADDSDFIYSIGTGAVTLEFGSYSAFDATGASGFAKVRYRLDRNPLYTAVSCTVELVQGTTALVTWNHTTAGGTLPSGLTSYEQTLTAGEMATINQSLPLRLRFTSG